VDSLYCVYSVYIKYIFALNDKKNFQVKYYSIGSLKVCRDDGEVEEVRDKAMNMRECFGIQTFID